MNMTSLLRIDLSLSNEVLYAGCEISEVGGRLTMMSPVDEAVARVGRNIRGIVEQVPSEQRRAGVVLSGPMAIWAYLIVFHAVLHTFSKVFYDDGRNTPVLVAQH